jgi:DNA topoisomerase-1
MHTITLEDAMELFKLPRNLGKSDEGDDVTVGVGRFGPFVKQGSVYASLKAEDDPYTIELPRALQLVQEKLEAIANRTILDFGNGIQVLNGRYGPYITDGEKNARIPKEREPKTLTEAECVELLAAAPVKKPRGGKAAKKTATKKAATKKAAAKKEPAVKKTAVKKAATKKTAAKKTTAKKAATKKTAAKKAPAKKTAVKKAAAKKSPAA